MEKLTREEFNALMAKAEKLRKAYPTANINHVVELACSEYIDRPDHWELLLQVSMHLVNQER